MDLIQEPIVIFDQVVQALETFALVQPRLMGFAGDDTAHNPHMVTYINKIDTWWPPEKIAAGLGVPGYAEKTDYNVINIAFWLPGSKSDPQDQGPTDIAEVFANPVKYFGDSSVFGSTKEEILTNIFAKYNDAGIKVLVSAFGATAPSSPSEWLDATDTCTALATFAKEHKFHGVDLDYECNSCLERGTGEAWLVDCAKAVRLVMPAADGYLLTHAPQGPYFYANKVQYPNGAYIKVNEEVGDITDWYNVQFYNQGETSYDTCDGLFNRSNGWALGTSVNEIIANGVESDKIVIGKPVTEADAYNTGWMKAGDLANCIKDANFTTGVMTWQYSSDVEGTFAEEVYGAMK